MRINTVAAVLVAAVSLTAAGSAEEVTRSGTQGSTGSISPSEPSGTLWVGLAASRNGRVFRITGDSESQAQSAARSECEETSGRACRAIAVPSQWDVVAIRCSDAGRTEAFLGGSRLGNASDIAYEKARRGGFDDDQCEEIYSD